MTIRGVVLFCLLFTAVLVPVATHAQAPPDASQAAPPAATSGAATVQPDPDLRIDLIETDFVLAALPTTLRMPRGKFAFRLTHRFSRPIAAGNAGDFFADLFGFDSSARIGLELRYGVRPGTEVTFYRTNDRSIQFLGQQQIVRQDSGKPVTAHGILAVEGANNFSEDFSVTVGAVVSRRFTGRAAVYAHPLVVFNSRSASGGTVGDDDDDTVMIGMGTRIRIGESRVYVVAEAAPRLTGSTTGVDHVTLAIEKRYGGHVFQFSVSNNLGTSLRQVARGGPEGHDWFVGFNLVRRFF
jgi:hypothetical protein